MMTRSALTLFDVTRGFLEVIDPTNGNIMGEKRAGREKDVPFRWQHHLQMTKPMHRISEQ